MEFNASNSTTGSGNTRPKKRHQELVTQNPEQMRTYAEAAQPTHTRFGDPADEEEKSVPSEAQQPVDINSLIAMIRGMDEKLSGKLNEQAQKMEQMQGRQRRSDLKNQIRKLKLTANSVATQKIKTKER